MLFSFRDQLQDLLRLLNISTSRGDDCCLGKSPGLCNRGDLGVGDKLDHALEIVFLLIGVRVCEVLDLLHLNERYRCPTFFAILQLRRGPSRAIPESVTYGRPNKKHGQSLTFLGIDGT